MKKSVSLLLSAALCVGLLAACGGGDSTPSQAAESAPAESQAAGAALSGTVATNGSTSMEKVMGALIEQFKTVQPDITVTYDPTGSGSGVEAATNGSADIGLASRNLKDEEVANGLTETVVAKDGIAIVVNPANTVEDLTVEQVAAIAKGEITNWKDLGGDDAEIAFIGREAGSGTRGAFEELTGTEDACAYNQELTSTGAVITAVSTTPGAIGYASLSAVDDSVKAVKIGGVECTEETVLDGSYAIQRPFVFATKTDAALSDAAQAFYDFATDPANAELYTAAGVVPAFR
ncbi:MAG: phosphate ABC transporter substrate-binding protein [Clostridiales bacterium]|nr:phosphate ABC transporter substrate-binding protein [Clostridiales bacterium]